MDFAASRTAVADAFAERMMAPWRELSPAPRTAFSIKQTCARPSLVSLRARETAVATPRHPPPMTIVWKCLGMASKQKVSAAETKDGQGRVRKRVDGRRQFVVDSDPSPIRT
jgi:hypothetical protein